MKSPPRPRPIQEEPGTNGELLHQRVARMRKHLTPDECAFLNEAIRRVERHDILGRHVLPDLRRLVTSAD